MKNVLDHRLLHRVGSSESVSQQERWSSDLLVDGESLLRTLNAGGGDLMGCFVRGFPAENRAKADSLLGRSPPDTEDGRILLYICPECGDISCGAFAVRVERDSGTVRWCDFAYVNGYEAPAPLDVSPFQFDEQAYERAITAASAI